MYLGLVEGACCDGGQVCIVMGFKLGYIAKLGWDGFTWGRGVSFGFKSLPLSLGGSMILTAVGDRNR